MTQKPEKVCGRKTKKRPLAEVRILELEDGAIGLVIEIKNINIKRGKKNLVRDTQRTEIIFKDGKPVSIMQLG